MKKLFLPLFLILIALSACDKKAGNSNSNSDSISAANKAAEMKAAREKAIADSLSKDSIIKDSINYIYYRTADLNAFFLHGRVKQCQESVTISQEGGSYTHKNVIAFNTQGVITSFSHADERMPITRSNGHIASAGQNEFAYQTMYTYTFNGNNQLIRLGDYNGHGGYTTTYRGYNADGLPVSAAVEGVYMHMGQDTETEGSTSFTYTAFDQNHNYTKCIEKSSLHEFGTTLDYDLEEDVDYDERRTVITNITRTITYYSREEVGL